MKPLLSRRQLLELAAGTALGSACRRVGAAPDDARPRPAATPAAPDDDGPAVCGATADNIEGPFYLPGAPLKDVLASARERGRRLELVGSVSSVDCARLREVELDFWQADAAGAYDLAGYHLRGRQRAANGEFALATILPGHYLNGDQYRPAHLHVKLRAPGHRSLTTQLYFAGDPYNRADPFIVDSLIMQPRQVGGVLRFRFDFVLEPEA